MPADHKTLLKFQRMELALIKAQLQHPNILTPREYATLRYLLGFVRLTAFTTGTALNGNSGTEVTVEPNTLAPLRELTLKALYRPLRRESLLQARLTESTPAIPALRTALTETRARLLRQLEGRVRPAELDAEAGRRSLVLVAGGGGGAGYVYVGAYSLLLEAGLAPKLIVGSSIGALLGAVLAHQRGADPAELVAFAKALRLRDIFGAKRQAIPTYTLPGLMRLHLAGLSQRLRNGDADARLSDLEIPYIAVVGGLRRNLFESMTRAVGRKRERLIEWLPFSARVAERMWSMTTYFTPGLVKEITLGRDSATAQVRVMDAVGLSAAIPGVLQYEPHATEPITHEILDGLRKDLTAASPTTCRSKPPGRRCRPGASARAMRFIWPSTASRRRPISRTPGFTR